jgi:hypothetical protein
MVPPFMLALAGGGDCGLERLFTFRRFAIA